MKFQNITLSISQSVDFSKIPWMRLSFICLHLNLDIPFPSCLDGSFPIWRNQIIRQTVIVYDELQYSLGNFLIFLIVPFLHFGQQVMSFPVNLSIISEIDSLIFSGNFISGSINFLIRATACFLFVWAKNPK